MIDVRRVRNFYVLSCLALLAACSNGRGSLDANQQTPPPSGGAQEGFTVGGTITGLQGDGLVLQINGGGNLAVANDGTFTFTSQLADQATYTVTVLTQPSSPSQTCAVGNAGGTIAGANITNVAVTCATGAFALHGTVSGLRGTGLVLQNGADTIAIQADGPFSFGQPVSSGVAYNVTVSTQPTGPSQTCTVSNGAGTVGASDVTNIAVNCATGTFAIGGTVTGLAGSGLKLRNGSETLDIGGNGSFQFAGTLASGAPYNVSVAANPSSPTQSCAVANGVGIIGSANVTNIAVTCMTDRFTIGGSISGLSGSGLQLRLNNERPFDVGAGANNFTLPSLLPSGASYVVRVVRNPSNPAQRCEVSPNTEAGIVGNANVTSVAITCTTSDFSIGGSVSGLRGDGLVLQKNGTDDITIASDGRFTFQTEQASGTTYHVTVRAQPTDPSQTCTVAAGSGTVGSGDVSSVQVRCDTNTFAVGGTVSGLLGSGLVLSNSSDDLPIAADGSFTFADRIASGSGFNVTVKTQPTNPSQACTVGNGSGTVGAGDVTNVVVNCSTSDFTVGGTVGGLAGTGLVLRNNGGDDLQVLADGSFAFPTTVPSGASYSVSVAAQPTGPAQECSVTNGSGLVGGDNVTSVQVSCVTTEFSVGGTVSGLKGTGLQLQNNGADTLAIAVDGPFTFPTSLPNNSPYNVTVVQQPSAPVQICVVTSGVGVVNGAEVTTVQVGCLDVPL